MLNMMRTGGRGAPKIEASRRSRCLPALLVHPQTREERASSYLGRAARSRLPALRRYQRDNPEHRQRQRRGFRHRGLYLLQLSPDLAAGEIGVVDVRIGQPRVQVGDERAGGDADEVGRESERVIEGTASDTDRESDADEIQHDRGVRTERRATVDVSR